MPEVDMKAAEDVLVEQFKERHPTAGPTAIELNRLTQRRHLQSLQDAGFTLRRDETGKTSD